MDFRLRIRRMVLDELQCRCRRSEFWTATCQRQQTLAWTVEEILQEKFPTQKSNDDGQSALKRIIACVDQMVGVRLTIAGLENEFAQSYGGLEKYAPVFGWRAFFRRMAGNGNRLNNEQTIDDQKRYALCYCAGLLLARTMIAYPNPEQQKTLAQGFCSLIALMLARQRDFSTRQGMASLQLIQDGLAIGAWLCCQETNATPPPAVADWLGAQLEAVGRSIDRHSEDSDQTYVNALADMLEPVVIGPCFLASLGGKNDIKKWVSAQT